MTDTTSIVVMLLSIVLMLFSINAAIWAVVRELKNLRIETTKDKPTGAK